LFVLFFINSAFASESQRVLLCDTCVDDPSFRSFARLRATAYVGDITVINITTGEARAYRSLLPTDRFYNEQPRLVAILDRLNEKEHYSQHRG
jgi:hypothetical protein